MSKVPENIILTVAWIFWIAVGCFAVGFVGRLAWLLIEFGWRFAA